MSLNPKVMVYGEAIVDFLPDRCGAPLRDVESFFKSVGGAPANVSIALARLGEEVSLMGKVGKDEFGHYLLNALRSEGVQVEETIEQTDEAKTGITFITLDASGDRSFLFFRGPSADMTLQPRDVSVDAIAAAEIFVYGSNLLTTPDPRAATWTAIRAARDHSLLRVTDPNVRLHLWDDLDEAKKLILDAIQQAHIIKINEDELEFLSPDQDAETF